MWRRKHFAVQLWSEYRSISGAEHQLHKVPFGPTITDTIYRELHVQQYQSALYAWSDAHNLTHTLDQSHKDTITSASRLLYPVLFSFSSSVPSGFLPSLSYPLWLPSNPTAVRRGMRGYSTAMEGNAFTGWPGDLPNPWRNPTICYRSASRSVRILIKPFLSENARVFKIAFSNLWRGVQLRTQHNTFFNLLKNVSLWKILKIITISNNY